MAIRGEKVSVTGGPGLPGFPPAGDLGTENDVFVMARFSDPANPAKVEGARIHYLTLTSRTRSTY
jgi:hypothetical protein